MRAIVLAFLMSAPASAWAQTAAGSNMPANFYPPSPCRKPEPAPKGAPGVADQAAMMTYNLRVKNYNAQAAAFNDCIHAYMDRAQNDVAHIQEIVHAAVADANTHE